ncbi:FRA10AC1 [Symbiodinium pilosum]|uniref:FRA10AC1 protein n=1 Tax=Symbiodinium pilosum TaxID=2952 RepID=A0A812JE50_SYMPI|nr:FRA10AC1 [Symbiodinium pilosum]
MPGASAVGYGSDDESAPPALPYGYGALPGDSPRRKRTATEIREYGIQQNSFGRVRSRSSAELQLRPTFAETRARPSLQYHKALLELVKKSRITMMKSDYDILKENHKFLRTEDADDGSWESRLARRYYDRLFKEYVICDLSGYREGRVGFRWRTEGEVLQGRGQFTCGHKHCHAKDMLKSYEVDFKYVEERRKRALVKVRLCQDCAFKLHYRRIKKARKRRRREAQTGAEEPEGEAAPEEDNLVQAKQYEPLIEADGAAAERDPDPEAPTASDLQLLESMAWRGPDPNVRSREDDIDDFLRDLFP